MFRVNFIELEALESGKWEKGDGRMNAGEESASGKRKGLASFEATNQSSKSWFQIPSDERSAQFLSQRLAATNLFVLEMLKKTKIQPFCF